MDKVVNGDNTTSLEASSFRPSLTVNGKVVNGDNLPEVAIIAIGRIQNAPQFAEDGDVYPVSIMTVNVGADHRVLDGATVARFCNEWKQYVEKPELLMLQMR